MKYALVGVDIEKHLIQVHFINEHTGEEWQTQRIPVSRALGHPVDGRKGVQQLSIQLDKT